MRQSFQFGPFRLDVPNQCLWHKDSLGAEERITLTPKAFAILQCFAERPGELVTQDDLLDAVWGDTHVQPDVLKRHIVDVRKILGDSPKEPRFIETAARRGYRFVSPVERIFEFDSLLPQTSNKRFVGRGREMADLQSWLNNAMGARPQVVFVSGEIGIGKTSLVDKFQRKISSLEFPAVHMACGQCIEGYGGIEPYYPMLEAISQLCRGAQGEGIVQTLIDKAPTWVVQLPALLKRRQRHLLQRDVLGATRERMLREMNEALEEITRHYPLLLIFEDIQWIDRSTIDLISSLSRRRSPMKLMLIATYRSADIVQADNPLDAMKRDLATRGLCREMILEPLGQQQVDEYLLADSENGGVSEDLSRLVYQYSEGNPLFMVSVVEHMAQRGLIFKLGGVWSLRGHLGKTDPGIPESLRRMIELQIYRLSLEERRILDAASVSGVLFQGYIGAIARNIDQNTFDDVCNDLARIPCFCNSQDGTLQLAS